MSANTITINNANPTAQRIVISPLRLSPLVGHCVLLVAGWVVPVWPTI